MNLVEEGEGAEEEGPEVDPLVEAPEPLQKPYGSTPNPTGRANPSLKKWKKAQRLRWWCREQSCGSGLLRKHLLTVPTETAPTPAHMPKGPVLFPDGIEVGAQDLGLG